MARQGNTLLNGELEMVNGGMNGELGMVNSEK